MIKAVNILPFALGLSKACKKPSQLNSHQSTSLPPLNFNSQVTSSRSKAPTDLIVNKQFSFWETINDFNPLERIRNSLIFAPSKKSYPIPPSDSKNLSEVFIDTPDGEKLHGYFMPAKEKTDKIVIYLHGNDFNISRWYLAPMNLQEHVPVNFLIVDYRGYGKSTGKPSTKGVITDALAMYKYLIDKGYKASDISVYGRSLGGGVVFELEKRVKLRSLVAQSSFASLRDLVRVHKSFLTSLLFGKNLFNSKELIKKTRVPVLISHGTKDKLIPLNQAYELYDAANEPKKLIILNGAGHEHLKEFYTEEYFEVLRELFIGHKV